MSSLEELNLAAISVVSDKTLHAAAKCTQLKYVNLKACKKVRNFGIEHHRVVTAQTSTNLRCFRHTLK